MNLGDTVYNIHGHKAEYVANTPAGHLIRYYYNAVQLGNSITRLSDTVLVDEIFETAPTAQLDKRVSELTSEIKNLTEVKKRLDEEIRDSSRNHERRLKELQKYPNLDRLDDFINGRITHIISESWGSYTIKTFEEALKTEDRWSKALKLITLYGRENSYEYRLNQYADGSGDSGIIYPCTSYEEAISKIKGFINDKIAVSLANLKSHNSCGPFHETIATIEKYDLGIEIPKEIKQYHYEKAMKEADDNIKYKEIALKEAIKAKENAEQTYGNF